MGVKLLLCVFPWSCPWAVSSPDASMHMHEFWHWAGDRHVVCMCLDATDDGLCPAHPFHSRRGWEEPRSALTCFLPLQGEKGDRGERVSGSASPWLLCAPGWGFYRCWRALQLPWVQGRTEPSGAVRRL